MITTSGHLEELRQRLIVSFGAIFFFAVLSYIFAEQIARFFMTPLFLASPNLIKLVYTNLTEAFITYIKLSLLLGIIFSIPVLLYELWMFIAPGLHTSEKKTVLIVVFWATLLFAGGATFAFFIVLPKALHFFMGFANPQLTPLPKLSGYLTFVARTSLAFGLAFEIPFLMVAAAKIGWVRRDYFSTRRKYFYPAILLLSVLLAAGDLMAAVLLCLPLFALYEAGIVIIRLFTKKPDISDALSSDLDDED
ncbi:MAG: twin-arginine translocase subunit TatC [Deltaproteobacteria bacterium]|nr:MAG: twin-arginine translocase subunit TatC [Deltaproteobacteria bacterium]